MSGRAQGGYSSRQQLAADIAFVAHLVLRYGEWLIPILDRLEAEMELLQRQNAPMDRARIALERYAPSIEVSKAIR